jgi:hypothetical protein
MSGIGPLSISMGSRITVMAQAGRKRCGYILEEGRRFFFIHVLACALSLLGGCGLSSVPSNITPAPVCDPNSAPEVRIVNVENSGAGSLQDYPVAVVLDQTNFNFTIAAKDGSDLAAWDGTTRQAMAQWLESYNPAAQKALLWVKVPALAAQGSLQFFLTAGAANNCTASASSGYTVFPFFSDVNDVANWKAANQLNVTNTTFQGPLTISAQSVIESDGSYNSTPAIVEAAQDDIVLTYLKGTAHVNSPFVVLRHSRDDGMTWTPEAIDFNTSQPDPGMGKTPSGAVLITFVKANLSGQQGGAYSRSEDGGYTWQPFTFFDSPPQNTFIASPLFNVGLTMYGAGYGPYSGGTGEASTVWSSQDDGFTWTKLSTLREAGDPGLDEIGLAQVGATTLFAMMRTDDGLDTFGRYSDDLGMTWGPLLSYTSQVGVLQDPQMVQAGTALILLGREASAIPALENSLTLGYPRQLVAFVSYDEGKTFGYGTVLDTYTGETIDGGYSWPLRLADGQVYVVYYADSHNLRQPDIKSVTLKVAPPVAVPANSIHVVSQLAAGLATQPFAVISTRYALEFRFQSNATPAGSQFSVLVQGANSGSPASLVNWELPSTHAADPTQDSGIISNGAFVPLLENFSYGDTYRLRTVIDEPQGTQQALVLDEFGAAITTTQPLPLAQAGSHGATVAIGNNSTVRATDTLLDFIFVRPAAQTEPSVSVLANQ